MTTSTTSQNAVRRPFGVHSLNHFALTVPSLEKARDFYRDFGLDVREEAGGLVLRAFGDSHPWGYCYPGERKALHHLCFGAYAEDLGALKARVEAEDIPTQDTAGSEGFDFSDPDGNRVEVRVSPKVTPSQKSPVVFDSVPGGERGAPDRQGVSPVKPRRLSHILLFTPDLQGAIDFYSRTLGIRLSDRSEEIVAFMHTVYGADHHTIAFTQSSAPGFHHCSWDVASVDEIGRGAMQMAERGWRDGWGTGRHVLGSNYFHYVRDPWGSYCEYSCDIDFIPAGTDWQAGNHPPEDSLYLWGPDVPDDFVRNHEAE